MQAIAASDEKQCKIAANSGALGPQHIQHVAVGLTRLWIIQRSLGRIDMPGKKASRWTVRLRTPVRRPEPVCRFRSATATTRVGNQLELSFLKQRR